jgi:uncharacterized membrane protein
MPKKKNNTAKSFIERDIKNELKSTLDVNQTQSDHILVHITDFFGSLYFLGFCLLFFVLYFLLNLNMLPGIKAFDPYPFTGLEMIVSVFAIVLTISVLMGQNRQRRLEKIREQVEFEVNVRAETEITKMLEMLHDIQRKLGIYKNDPELEKMKESINLDELHKSIGENDKMP